MIFSRYFKSGAKALDSEAEAWVRRIQSGQATRRDALALREWCAHSDAHAAAFERARRAWVDIGQAGRAFRAAHPRGGGRAGAARPPGAAARGPGQGRRGSGRRRAAAVGLVGQPGRTGRGLQHGGGRAAHRRLGRRAGRGRTGRAHPHERGRRSAPPGTAGRAGRDHLRRAGPGPDRRGRRRRDPAGRRQRGAEPQRRRGHGHLPAGPRGYPPSLARTGAGSRPAGALRRRSGDGAGARRPGAGHGLARGRAGVPRHAAGRGGGRDQPLPARPHHGAGRCAGGAAGQRALPDRPAGSGDRPDPRGLRRACASCPRASCY